MNYLIIHGIQGRAGKHWQQWLHDQLSSKQHNVIMETYPNPDHPDRSQWLATAQASISNIPPEDLIIVTHSLGAVTALDLIEDMTSNIRGLVTVAGFYRDYGAELNSYFLINHLVNIATVKNKLIKKSVVIFGDDDPYVPQIELHALAKGLETEPIIIPQGGHLNTDSGFVEFPILLEKCLLLA
jgi:predicted alpha/beta hydrolase family esterase